MSFTPPGITAIQTAFPELQSLTFHRQGGYKAVYRAKTAAGIEAFKLLCLPAVRVGSPDEEAQQASRSEHLSRALREVEILGKVETPEIVKLGTIAARIENVDGVECLGYSEEWLEGESLWELIRAFPQMFPPEEECRVLTRSLINAVQALWNLEKVHRDIKPMNIMKIADSNRQFVLLDLGIAYDLSEPGLTYNPAIIPCTYRYMAPEMTEPRFREKLDFRCDLYSAGLTIFEYAAGRHPIARDKDDDLRTISRAINEIPPTLSSIVPHFSAEFCSIVDQFLKKKPMLRPGNLDQLKKRLDLLP